MSLRSLASSLADALADGGWRSKARTAQLPPPDFTGDGPANGWLYMGGRGTGKTRAGAEWVKELVETGAARHIGRKLHPGDTPFSADGRDEDDRRARPTSDRILEPIRPNPSDGRVGPMGIPSCQSGPGAVKNESLRSVVYAVMTVPSRGGSVFSTKMAQ